MHFVDIVLQPGQALASSGTLVSFMEDCASMIDTQGLQAERAPMPLAAGVADLLRGSVYIFLLYGSVVLTYAQRLLLFAS